MQSIYKYLAHLIALLVVFQSAVVVWGMAEEIRYRMDNPTATGETPFPIGALLHGMVGMYVIPIAALVLVAVSLFMRNGRRWALLVLLAAVVQVALGLGGIMVSEYLGLLHGIVAFVLLGLAEYAAWTVGRRATARAEQPRAAATVG